MARQIDIPGIGQQLYTLSDWKKENKIFTHHQDAEDDLPWSCWDEIECPFGFMEKYGCHCIARGKTEFEAISTYCEWNGIEIPKIVRGNQ